MCNGIHGVSELGKSLQTERQNAEKGLLMRYVMEIPDVIDISQYDFFDRP